MDPESAVEVVEQTADMATLLYAVQQSNDYLFMVCAAVIVLIGAVVGVGLGILVQRLFNGC